MRGTYNSSHSSKSSSSEARSCLLPVSNSWEHFVVLSSNLYHRMDCRVLCVWNTETESRWVLKTKKFEIIPNTYIELMSNDAAVYSSLLTPRTWTVKHWWHHKRCNNMATFQWQHTNALQFDGILARMHFTQQGRKWDKNSLNIYGCILENYHLGLTLVSHN
jgi:hypothetical protein